MADRNKASIVGTIVPNVNMNIDAWIEHTKQQYETPDKFGKSKSVEFDVQETFIDFWVS